MASDAAAIVTVIGGAIPTVIGAYALLIKARAAAAEPLALLQRVWDYVEDKDLVEHFPASLTNAVRRALDAKYDQGGSDDQMA